MANNNDVKKFMNMIYKIKFNNNGITEDEENELIEIILENKEADFNVTDYDVNPLYTCVSIGTINVVKELLKLKNIDINKRVVTESIDTSSLEEAICNYDQNMIDLLLSDQRLELSVKDFMAAVYELNTGLIDRMIDLGMELNSVGQSYYIDYGTKQVINPISYSVYYNDTEATNHLIDIGGDLNLFQSNDHSPLSIACYFGYEECTKSILLHSDIFDDDHLRTAYKLIGKGMSDDIAEEERKKSISSIQLLFSEIEHFELPIEDEEELNQQEENSNCIIS
eukprot:TRINITY_DN3052_c0_g1_i1.p1 TRINITY_DN3052_c0_g1~~TRINITY_DN3052_c0_g1_i1.p1  ORF type:complete len:281 (-),score=80.86 TRINITY_DN3052_c0_g1_i1:94-936(-)